VSAPAFIDVAQPEVDKFGWISVGGQPIAARYRDIRPTPLSYVNVVLKSKLDVNSKTSDCKVPGANLTRLDQDAQMLAQDPTVTLAPQGDRFVKRLCDYTGIELIQMPGPRSMSLEAVYPFSSQNGSLRYHVSPKGHFIVSALNLAKSGYPIAALPLVAMILDTGRRSNNAV
jgi:hypothetical protein